MLGWPQPLYVQTVGREHGEHPLPAAGRIFGHSRQTPASVPASDLPPVPAVPSGWLESTAASALAVPAVPLEPCAPELPPAPPPEAPLEPEAPPDPPPEPPEPPEPPAPPEPVAPPLADAPLDPSEPPAPLAPAPPEPLAPVPLVPPALRGVVRSSLVSPQPAANTTAAVHHTATQPRQAPIPRQYSRSRGLRFRSSYSSCICFTSEGSSAAPFTSASALTR